VDTTDPKQMAPLEHALDEVRDHAVRQVRILDSGELAVVLEQLASLVRQHHADGRGEQARTSARALAATATLYLVRTDRRTAEDFASPAFVENLIKRRGLEWLLEGKGKKE
jgi:AcrR family transcriptional regulator